MIELDSLRLDRDEAPLDWSVADGCVSFLLCRSRDWLRRLYQALRGYAAPLSGCVRMDGRPVAFGCPDTGGLYAEGLEGGGSGDWVLGDFLALQMRLSATPEERLWPQLVRCGVDPAVLARRAGEVDPGTRTMLFLAMSLAAGGRNWVLLDVVRGLGADAELRLRQLLQDHRRGGAGAVLYLSDDVFWAAQAADRVGIVRGGQVALDLKAEALRGMDVSRLHFDFLRGPDRPAR